jgi:hypothetical protein
MYEAPTLTRFGTFRELTRTVWNGHGGHHFLRALEGSDLVTTAQADDECGNDQVCRS